MPVSAADEIRIEIGSILEGKITAITNFGAFVSLGDNKNGMIHISEISDSFVRDIKNFVTVGLFVKVMVIGIDENNKIALSLKRATAKDSENNYDNKTQEKKQEKIIEINDKTAFEIINPPSEDFASSSRKNNKSFEDMLNKFKNESDEKISDLKKSYDSKRPGAGFNRKNKYK